MNLWELHRRFRQFGAIEKGWSGATLKGQKAALSCFIHRTNITQLHELKEDTLRNWFYEGRERYQWSASNYGNYWLYFKQFFDWCLDRGFCNENPVLAISKPKRAKSLPRRITSGQAEKLLYTSYSMPWSAHFYRLRNHAIIATFLYSGLRASELLNLKCAHVSLAEREIFVEKGKGDKDRIVFIGEKLKIALKPYLEEVHRQGIASLYFFSSLRGNRLTYKNLWLVIRSIGKAAKAPATCHQFRHTFASMCIENGYNPYELQLIMGHESFQTTERYLSLTPEKAKENFLKMPSF
ncbi:Tyrosine-type recombinase/integrase [Sulfidibacter corallicola]|uniref:Tyrosine-type recombinase/integrase n=1 Tax=Sulfidibacter corallicola TaxID=2818388 RepID=A0A8A4TRD1_SULCO|nr:tyrosine-type recombinase/integrase [Sulfidibacter corallicola]QTD52110.1 tyrosine-type recombinase/integrase [Sulfidibacter corallicola]